MKRERLFWNVITVALILGLTTTMWVLAVSPDTLIDLGSKALYWVEK